MEIRNYMEMIFGSNMSNSIEIIKRAMKEPGIEIISFDVFDTLVVRPLERSTDIFELLDKMFGEMSDASISFHKLRNEAESVLRRRIIRGEYPAEDITLTDIYKLLHDEFGIDKHITDSLMQEEVSIECKLLRPRESGRVLWDEAMASGREVIITSDMYLEKKHIEKILFINGYEGYKDIFVSSDTGKRKTTGNLYRYVSESLGVPASAILHIGDNRESDYKMALQAGFKAMWLPSAISVYDRFGCSHQVEKICTDLTDWEAAKTSVGIGAMRAMAANRYFDDPFRSFEPDSDYNADPYFVGYGALGMHLLSLTKWLSENVLRDRVSRLVFMARDGYLPKIAYDIYRKTHPELPPSDYLHVSRRSLLPAIINEAEDLYDLPVDITYQTPEKILRLLCFCDRFNEGALSEADSEDIGSESEEQILGFERNLHFTKDSFIAFIDKFIKERYDAGKHMAAKQHIKDYLNKTLGEQLGYGTALFDMGYSGRIPAAIINVTGMVPAIYYFHADARNHFRYEKKSGMKVRSFFDFNPYMEASLREYSYLEAAASCIGYNEDLEEIFDAGPAKGYADAALRMQIGAIDFVNDFLMFFGEYEAEASFRLHEGTMPFEAFIRFVRGRDLDIYDKVLIDDELWGGRRDIDLHYLINARRSKLPEYAIHDVDRSSAEATGSFSKNIRNTVLRESALNWYEFKKDSSVLLIDNGDTEVIRGLLERRCGRVTSVPEDSEKYDYIICLDVKGDSVSLKRKLAVWIKTLAPGGKILLAAGNRYALRNFCGDRTGMDSRDEIMSMDGRYTRGELADIIEEAGDGRALYKFYYPVPDILMPQMIFTDDYMVGINARERLNDYNYGTHRMDIMEHRLFGDVIDGGALPFMSDSFLLEITKDGKLSDIDYAVVTTDRGPARGMATTVRHSGRVYKRPLWSEGAEQLKKLKFYTEKLKMAGVPVVETELRMDEYGTFLDMPLITHEGLSTVLEKLIENEKEQFLGIFDAIYEYIRMSARMSEEGEGEVFLDLAPCNAFFIPQMSSAKNSILFYDQEFAAKGAVPEYAMYRTVRYFFESSPKARMYMSADEMYKRYGFTREMLKEFEEKEKDFISEVRNTDDHAWLMDASACDRIRNGTGKPYHVGYVPGVFDLFHKGHLRLFERCKERCDILIVGVLTDELVEFYKNKRPVISLEDRMEVIKGLRCVDRVIPVDFSNTDKLDAWEQLHYDCHFSGDDHVGHWNDVMEELRKRGSNMEFLSYTNGISSTEIREKMNG